MFCFSNVKVWKKKKKSFAVAINNIIFSTRNAVHISRMECLALRIHLRSAWIVSRSAMITISMRIKLRANEQKKISHWPPNGFKFIFFIHGICIQSLLITEWENDRHRILSAIYGRFPTMRVSIETPIFIKKTRMGISSKKKLSNFWKKNKNLVFFWLKFFLDINWTKLIRKLTK